MFLRAITISVTRHCASHASLSRSARRVSVRCNCHGSPAIFRRDEVEVLTDTLRGALLADSIVVLKLGPERSHKGVLVEVQTRWHETHAHVFYSTHTLLSTRGTKKTFPWSDALYHPSEKRM